MNKDLLIDLSARLPYGVRGTVPVEVATGHYDMIDGSMLYDEKEILVELVGIGDGGYIDLMILEKGWEDYDISDYEFTLDDFTPLLRPMESMTEEEQHEYDNLHLDNLALPKVRLYYPMRWYTMDYLHVDWLNAHHFDYRGLIPKDLAAAVTVENNPYK